VGSFLIVEHNKSNQAKDRKFWRGGKYEPGFFVGIYRASNFRSIKGATKALDDLRSGKKAVKLREDRDYTIQEFQEAKKYY
jgi:hypothetical protein